MIHIILIFKSMYVNPYLSFRSKKVDTVTFVFKNTFYPYKQKLYFAMHLFPKHAAKYSLIFFICRMRRTRVLLSANLSAVKSSGIAFGGAQRYLIIIERVPYTCGIASRADKNFIVIYFNNISRSV